MAVVSKAASSAAVVTTGWSSPANAEALTGDNVYATAAPAKSATINSDFGFAFALSDFPGAGAAGDIVIDQIVVTCEWKISSVVTNGLTLGVQLREQSGGTLLGTETTDTASTADTQKTQTVTSGIDAAGLIAGNLAARVRATRGTTNTGVTGSLDFVKVDVTYHLIKSVVPASISVTSSVTASLKRLRGIIPLFKNSVPNGSFEADASGWFDWIGTNSALSRGTGDSAVGADGYLQATQAGGAAYTGVTRNDVVAAASTTQTWSVYVKPASDVTVALTAQDAAGNWGVQGSFTFCPNGVWTRVTATGNPGTTPGINLTFRLDRQTGTWTAAEILRWDGFQQEVGSSATAYKNYGDDEIVATSDITATVGKAGAGSSKAVTPAAINVTSAVTASVVRRRPVTPASVSATSNVTASLGAIRKVVPASISASSAVTASVVRIRRLTVAAINATSNVTSGLGAIRRVIVASISATSAVTASVGRVKPLTVAAITSTSSVTAALSRVRVVVPAAITSTSAVTATVNAIHRLAVAAISSTSAVTATLTRLRSVVVAPISASSNVTASVVRRRPVVVAAINATSAVTATVGRVRPVIVAAINATSSVSASVGRLLRIVGASISTTSNVTASVSKAAGLKSIVPAAITSTSSVTLSLSRRRNVVPASINATSSVTAALVALRAVKPASITSTSNVTASLRFFRAVSGIAITATSSVTASLVAKRSISGAAVVSTSAVTLSVSRIIRISPSILSTSTVSASVILSPTWIPPLPVLESATKSGVSTTGVTKVTLDATITSVGKPELESVQ